LAPDAVEITIPDSAPAIPARYAEMQKTITIVTRTLVPLVVSASGESDMERSRRPRRLRFSTTPAGAAPAPHNDQHHVIEAGAAVERQPAQVRHRHRDADVGHPEHHVRLVEHVLH